MAEAFGIEVAASGSITGEHRITQPRVPSTVVAPAGRDSAA